MEGLFRKTIDCLMVLRTRSRSFRYLVRLIPNGDV